MDAQIKYKIDALLGFYNEAFKALKEAINLAIEHKETVLLFRRLPDGTSVVFKDTLQKLNGCRGYIVDDEVFFEDEIKMVNYDDRNMMMIFVKKD